MTIKEQAREDLRRQGWGFETIQEILGPVTHKEDFIERAAIAFVAAAISSGKLDTAHFAVEAHAVWDALYSGEPAAINAEYIAENERLRLAFEKRRYHTGGMDTFPRWVTDELDCAIKNGK